MDVAPHLCQPLTIDTNIAYSLDLSKFPGLDDPQQKYEPALLIAQPGEIIPSPTSDLQNEDFLAITDWHNSVLESSSVESPANLTCTVLPPRKERRPQQVYHSHHLQSNQQPLQSTRTIYQRFNSNHELSSSQHSSGRNNLAKYALQAIFQNLIYPDVSRSRQFTLDTLVQSAASEPAADNSCSPFQSIMEGYEGRLKHITNSVSACSNSSLGAQRYGKRKRSSDQSYDNETLKRLRYDNVSSNISNMQYPAAYSGYNQGRAPMHRRVRELMCHM